MTDELAPEAEVARIASDERIELAEKRKDLLDTLIWAVVISLVVLAITVGIVVAVVRTSAAARVKESRNCAAVAALPAAERQGVDVNRICAP